MSSLPILHLNLSIGFLYGTYGMDRLLALIRYGDCPLSHHFCQQVVHAHSDL